MTFYDRKVERMEYIRPDYYDEFSCIGGACPDTCCSGWQIVIDKESQERYKRQKGIFGNRLRNEIDWKEGVFKQYKGDCCFLNEKGLCDIYTEIGKEELCQTCKSYPRYTEEYEGLKEQYLCISCPVVADMLLGREKKTTLVSFYREEAEEEYEDFDFLLFTKLQDSREILLEHLQNRNVPIDVRMGLLIGFGHDMQRRIRNGRIFEMDQLIEKYKNPAAIDFFRKKRRQYTTKSMQERYDLSGAVFEMLLNLEIRRPEWKRWVEKCKETMHDDGILEYKRKRTFYEKQVRDEGKKTEHEMYQEQIVVYFLLHYYCGAVYDERIYTKIKMAVISAYIIDEMLCAGWCMKKDSLEREDWVAITYQYARELEHSDLNLMKMEKELTTRKEYALKRIFAAL